MLAEYLVLDIANPLCSPLLPLNGVAPLNGDSTATGVMDRLGVPVGLCPTGYSMSEIELISIEALHDLSISVVFCKERSTSTMYHLSGK
jgi:hypothetical protein